MKRIIGIGMLGLVGLLGACAPDTTTMKGQIESDESSSLTKCISDVTGLEVALERLQTQSLMGTPTAASVRALIKNSRDYVEDAREITARCRHNAPDAADAVSEDTNEIEDTIEYLELILEQF